MNVDCTRSFCRHACFVSGNGFLLQVGFASVGSAKFMSYCFLFAVYGGMLSCALCGVVEGVPWVLVPPQLAANLLRNVALEDILVASRTAKQWVQVGLEKEFGHQVSRWCADVTFLLDKMVLPRFETSLASESQCMTETLVVLLLVPAHDADDGRKCFHNAESASKTSSCEGKL
jgi:hypothetical protein